MTNNGSNTITIPAGDWDASLAVRSDALPSSLLGEGESMIFHLDASETNPDNSQADANRDLEGCGPITISDKTDSSNHDAEMDIPGLGNMGLTSSDLEMPYDGTQEQIAGMYFDTMRVPQGATIQNAYITFEADGSESGTVNIKFYGEDVDAAGVFTSSNGDLNSSNRPRTTASYSWSSVPSWSNGVHYSMPTSSLNSIIQEIVDRAGWKWDNKLVIIVEDNGSTASQQRRAHADDDGSNDAPEIFITFITSNSGAPPTFRAGLGPHGSGTYEFDGVNDCLRSNEDVANVESNNIDEEPDTTALWFKTTAAIGSNDQHLVYWNAMDKTCPSCDRYEIFLEATTGKIVFTYNTSNGSHVTTCKSVNSYDDLTWYHITAVREGTPSVEADECNLYIHNLSGALTETAINQNNAHTSDDVDTVGRWYIGMRSQETPNWYKGYIDDVIHWNDKALTSVEAADLAKTNYGTGAHQLNVNLDLTDQNGVFVSNLYNGPTDTIAFQDSKGQGGTIDSAYAMLNVTMNLPQTIVLPLQRLNFSMAYVPSTSTWEALPFDMKIDDSGFITPYPSYLQIPPPDNPFPSYLVYDKTTPLELFINNIGDDGIFFIYSGTRLSFDGDTGSYASLIRYINGTSGGYQVDINRDSIYIPQYYTNSKPISTT